MQIQGHEFSFVVAVDVERLAVGVEEASLEVVDGDGTRGQIEHVGGRTKSLLGALLFGDVGDDTDAADYTAVCIKDRRSAHADPCHFLLVLGAVFSFVKTADIVHDGLKRR